jgi:hypothetical protein
MDSEAGLCHSHVVDVAMAVDADTGVTTCRVFPLIRSGAMDIRVDDPSF